MVATAQLSPPIADRRGHAPLLGLCALGLAITGLVALGPWLIRAHGYGVFVPCVAASGLLTLAATALAPAVPARAGLLVVLAAGVVMRLLVVGEDPFLSTDIYRYVWDGRVQAAGINPYAHVPADAALEALRDAAIYPNINRADYAVTAYPPVAQMLFLAVTRISESLTGMRLAMVGCEIIIVAVMIDLLRRLRLPETAVVAWVWHPLAIWEIANNGHVDALMVALLMLGVWLLVRNRALAGTVAVALAALVKPYVVVALPVFWRPWDWRTPLTALATVAVCYLPYLAAGSGVLGFVTTGYLAEEGVADGQGLWLVALARAAAGDFPGLTAGYALVALGVLGVLAHRTVSRPEPTAQSTLRDVALLMMVGLFFLSPNYPWYFLAAVPFTVLGGGAPAWAMTLAAILLCRPLTLPANDLAWKSLATLPFVIAVASALLVRRGVVTRIQKALPWTT